MLTIGQEGPTPIEINAGGEIQAFTFTAHGKFLVSGDSSAVQVWRVNDAKQVARMDTGTAVLSLAASKDGKWIAAGTNKRVVVWDTMSFKRV